jgi:DNA-binding HxlR family transcriptional regulator
MKGYGQYCPISRAAEVLGDRWTILIVRDLLTGATRFNELVRGNPGLSRSLLSRRLDQLVRADIVDRRPDGTYRLTPAGEHLRPVVFGLAAWGARWAFGEPEPEQLDPDLLVWWLHRGLDPPRLPRPRATVALRLTDHRKRYWIVVEDEASVCLTDPGFDVDVTLISDRSTLYRVYLGRLGLRDAVRAGGLELIGSRRAVSAFMAAFGTSPVADVVAEGLAGSG